MLVFAPWPSRPGGMGWACPTARWLHVPCPTCGLTRALRAAMNGAWRGSFRLHPLWPLAVLTVGWLVIERIVHAPGDLPRSRLRARTLGVIAALFVAVWLARFLGAFGGSVAV